MDRLRSGYKAKMRLWDDGPPIDVIWYRVPEDTPEITWGTPFRSTEWWRDKYERENHDLGEQIPYSADPDEVMNLWYRGNAPFPGHGKEPCGDKEAWAKGGVRGITPEHITDALGRCPECSAEDQAILLPIGFRLDFGAPVSRLSGAAIVGPGSSWFTSTPIGGPYPDTTVFYAVGTLASTWPTVTGVDAPIYEWIGPQGRIRWYQYDVPAGTNHAVQGFVTGSSVWFAFWVACDRGTHIEFGQAGAGPAGTNPVAAPQWVRSYGIDQYALALYHVSVPGIVGLERMSAAGGWFGSFPNPAFLRFGSAGQVLPDTYPATRLVFNSGGDPADAETYGWIAQHFQLHHPGFQGAPPTPVVSREMTTDTDLLLTTDGGAIIESD